MIEKYDVDEYCNHENKKPRYLLPEDMTEVIYLCDKCYGFCLNIIQRQPPGFLRLVEAYRLTKDILEATKRSEKK